MLELVEDFVLRSATPNSEGLSYLQQGLQPVRLPVSEVEEAVARVMSMQSGVGALRHLTGRLPDRSK